MSDFPEKKPDEPSLQVKRLAQALAYASRKSAELTARLVQALNCDDALNAFSDGDQAYSIDPASPIVAVFEEEKGAPIGRTQIMIDVRKDGFFLTARRANGKTSMETVRNSSELAAAVDRLLKK